MSWPMRVFSDTAYGRAKISARVAVATTHVLIAPDLSHACTLHRPGRLITLLAKNASFQRSRHRFGV